MVAFTSLKARGPIRAVGVRHKNNPRPTRPHPHRLHSPTCRLQRKWTTVIFVHFNYLQRLISLPNMGHSDSMSPVKSGSNDEPCPTSFSSSAPSQRGVNSTKPFIAALDKPVHHDNPVELVRVKLQDPVGYSSDSPWSSEGLKPRSSILFTASQAPKERPASFALRAPRLQSKVDSHSVHSAQTTPLTDSDESEMVAVDNQTEDEDQHDALSERELLASWRATPRVPSEDKKSPDNQELEPRGLSLNLNQLQNRNSALPESQNHHAVDIWKNPINGFEDVNFSSSKSPVASADQRTFASSNTRSISSRISRVEDNIVNDCAPPGMSLIDRIQEDFPRTPSPEYEQLDEGTRGHSLGGIDHLDQSMFNICEDMGQLRLGSYRSGPFSTDSRSCDFEGLYRMPQRASVPRLAGVNHFRHTFGRSTIEPRFEGSYHGAMAQGYPSSYTIGAEEVQSYPVLVGANKSRWAVNEEAYSFQSLSLGYTPSEFTSALPAHGSTMATYPFGYVGEYHGVRSTDKTFKACPSYPLVDHPLHERHHFGSYMYRPHMVHKPKVEALRRSELEFFHPVAHSYSSNSLLEEFNLAPKSEKWELAGIKGHLYLFAKDQTGSRFIQQKLEKADDRLKADAFNEIFPNSLLLMTDVFGNYVIQKFLEYGSLEQQQLLVELMTSNMISLALQVYGCRVIQRALEVTQVEEQLTLIRQLKGHVMKCVVDQNGNHVLQKCIEAASWKRVAEHKGMGCQRYVTGQDIQFIIDSFVGHAAVLSTHSYGCRVIQRVLEHCAPEQIRLLLSEIILKCHELVEDQFGNYVVQHVISHGELEHRNIVMQAVLPEIARWSQHKYASNVVEACLEHATKEEISQIVDFILQCDESGASCVLLPMMKHMYGNYVVQKLLERADEHDRQRIVCIIRHNEGYLKRFTFGKHVLSRLEPVEQANNFY
ncbi:hypothetical protein PsorP6_008156 [Peronosclerospora sorghi]|uniref:Uncharacterized protein n=1 Tax=Peronosclerospora sorghi TaxID=230839 RepID=A0ACC0W9H0_9STRA|nr:hypothetical protein PsorP6_008156 [Peronosclerospora sorghi]